LLLIASKEGKLLEGSYSDHATADAITRLETRIEPRAMSLKYPNIVLPKLVFEPHIGPALTRSARRAPHVAPVIDDAVITQVELLEP
jgi:hypothetical protein